MLGAYYGSQVQSDAVAFPDGVSLRVEKDEVVMTEFHVINAAAEDVASEVWLNASYPPPGAAATREAGSLLFFHDDILVPPQGSETARMRCALSEPVEIAFLIPHMHARGRAFRAWAESPAGTIPLVDAGEAIESAKFDPPLVLPASSTIRFECDFENAGATVVYDGFSAIDDEMCMLFAGYFAEAGPRLGLSEELCRGEDSGVTYGGTGSCSALYDCDNATWWDYPDPESDAESMARHTCRQSACEDAFDAWKELTACIDASCQEFCWVGLSCDTQDCPECLACIESSCGPVSDACAAATCGT